MLSIRRTAPLPQGVRGRQLRFVSECAKAVTCPHAVSIFPSRRDDRRRFINDTNDLRRFKIGNRLAIRHGDS